MNNQQAIDRLVKHLEYGWSEPTVEAIDMGIHALIESRWIPCSERLPEELIPVNITWINRELEEYYSNIKGVPFSGTAVIYNNEWYWFSSVCTDYLKEYGKNEIDKVDSAIEITHWMPLPEPYKGE